MRLVESDRWLLLALCWIRGAFTTITLLKNFTALHSYNMRVIHRKMVIAISAHKDGAGG